MKYADFNTSQFPIIHVRVNPVKPTVDQYYSEFLKPHEDLLARHEKMIWIIDSRNVTWLSSDHRIMANGWVKAQTPLMQQKVKVAFMTHCSFWTEMMIKGILAMIKAPIPFHLCADVSAVRSILKEKYQMEVPEIKVAP